MLNRALWQNIGRKGLGMIGLEPDTDPTNPDQPAEHAPTNPGAIALKQPITPAQPAVQPAMTPGPSTAPATSRSKSTFLPTTTAPTALPERSAENAPEAPAVAPRPISDPHKPQRMAITPALREELDHYTGHVLTSPFCPDDIRLTEGHSKVPTECLLTEHGTLLTDSADPWNTQTQLWMKRASKTRHPVTRIILAPINIIREIHEAYEKRMNSDTKRKVVRARSDGLDDSETVKKAFTYINTAFKKGATDIHFDTEDSEGYIWYRINSLLVREATITRSEMITILKVLHGNMSGASTSSYSPKDSMEQATIDGADERTGHLLDKLIARLRCQFRPVGNEGGSLVMRINARDQSRNLTLRQIGYARFQRDIIETATYAPNGLIWITGPTSCGKSMTAKTVLDDIGSRYTEDQRLAIMTIEDPREYDYGYHIQATSLPGSKTREEHAAKFAAMIEVLLRSNPNINFFGETRSGEILKLVFQSSETGHLTFSTLHVNSVHGVFTRERGMGAPDYYVYSEDILKAAMAQRLVPKVCPHCAMPWEADAGMKAKLHQEVDDILSAHPGLASLVRQKRPGGCDQCKPQRSGQMGRVAICEVLKPDLEYIEIQRDKGENAAIKYWKANLQGLSFAEHGLYKMIRGMIDPRDMQLQTGPIPLICPPERIRRIIELCSDGTETPESLIAAGPMPTGEMFEPI